GDRVSGILFGCRRGMADDDARLGRVGHGESVRALALLSADVQRRPRQSDDVGHVDSTQLAASVVGCDEDPGPESATLKQRRGVTMGARGPNMMNCRSAGQLEARTNDGPQSARNGKRSYVE